MSDHIPPQDETSEINYEVLKRGGLLAAQWRFVAWVDGPGGRRALAHSGVVYGHTPEIQRSLGAAKELDRLVALAFGEGWTALPPGERWYNRRFARSASERTEPRE